MRIVDGFAAAADCFPGGQFSLKAWQAYAGSISPQLAQLCLDDVKDYDFDALIAPVLADYAARQTEAHQAHKAFLRCAEGLEEHLAALGLAVDATVVLYLGLCSGAGWATDLDDAPAVLLGLEKILELNWHDEASMQALLHHELGHLWHFQHRSSPVFESAALWQLYTEGMAMYFEQLLHGDVNAFHQNKNGWLAWCETNRDALFAEYHRRVKVGESVQDFFGDWCSYQGYSDVGYYLGSVLIWHLSQNHSMAELAELTETDVLNALSQVH